MAFSFGEENSREYMYNDLSKVFICIISSKSIPKIESCRTVYESNKDEKLRHLSLSLFSNLQASNPSQN